MPGPPAFVTIATRLPLGIRRVTLPTALWDLNAKALAKRKLADWTIIDSNPNFPFDDLICYSPRVFDVQAIQVKIDGVPLGESAWKADSTDEGTSIWIYAEDFVWAPNRTFVRIEIDYDGQGTLDKTVALPKCPEVIFDVDRKRNWLLV